MNKKYLELKEKLLTDYELQKKFFELAQKFTSYCVSMIIFDIDYTFSNLNAKTYDNLEEANIYFSSLKDLIKNNDLENLSSTLLKNCQ